MTRLLRLAFPVDSEPTRALVKLVAWIAYTAGTLVYGLGLLAGLAIGLAALVGFFAAATFAAVAVLEPLGWPFPVCAAAGWIVAVPLLMPIAALGGWLDHVLSWPPALGIWRTEK